MLHHCRLNKGPVSKRELVSMPVPQDECTNPTLGYMSRRDLREARGVVRRQETVVPGYTTQDDWGTDGTLTSTDIAHHEMYVVETSN